MFQESQNRQRSKPKWITDFLTMNEFNKFILSTGLVVTPKITMNES